jgi:hypothetical protein
MSKQELFEGLDELREAQQKAREEYEAENDAWWNGLTEAEREDAFYAVCKRIWKGDLVDRGTYRHTLYNVFEFDMSMYGRGMECRYMAIHNALYDGDELQKMKNVTRFEVIDETGRGYVKYLKDEEGIKYSLQDDDRTLKVFIDELRWKEDL